MGQLISLIILLIRSEKLSDLVTLVGFFKNMAAYSQFEVSFQKNVTIIDQ